MELADTFIPTAGTVGILPMLTYYAFVITFLVFLGQTVFVFSTKSLVEPEHQVSHLFGGVIAIVAGYAYFQMQGFYRDMLEEMAALGAIGDSPDRVALVRKSYSAISQYRFMDWTITTPLLLLTMVRLLKVKFNEASGAILLMVFADIFMIVTGYIGEQQVSFDQEILVGPKMLWGAISTVGYVIALVVLYRLYKQYGVVDGLERPFRMIALTTVTFWGIYPIGYILTTTGIDVNYIHIAFAIGDMINKMGVAALLFITVHQQPSAQLSRL